MMSIFQMAEDGNVSQLRQLLERGNDYNINAHDNSPPYHMTALQYACAEGHETVGRLLLSYGADVNLPDGSHIHRTALHYACQYGQTTIVKLLLENGADVNALDDAHRTPLFWACSYTDYGEEIEVTETILLLLQYGADLNARDVYDLTPLHVACQASTTNSFPADFLLELGADPTLRDFRGLTAVDFTTNTELQRLMF